MPALPLYDVPQLYDLIVGPGPCEAFYREEARGARGPVLELACGTGRLTVPIALDGHPTVGLDSSAVMLDAARAKARAARADAATFVQGDMRSFALRRRFALIIVSCNSLAHLTTNGDLKAGLGRIAEHLLPGGTLAFDIVNPDLRALAGEGPETVRSEGPPGDEVTVRERARYDPVAQVRTASFHVRRNGRPARELLPLCLRQIFPQELPLLLDSADLALVARYGDFDRNPFSADSPNQICVARPAGPARDDAG